MSIILGSEVLWRGNTAPSRATTSQSGTRPGPHQLSPDTVHELFPTVLIQLQNKLPSFIIRTCSMLNQPGNYGELSEGLAIGDE